eukprot:TRINITY_DN33510_c1_g1_i2.p1 TRINITY_DN33510_c1_g1~~TRINITY_DN33510_c1_g1_i2.p1  ORF type:complete len:204 (+),score=44.10 TRINITY_DN33510_c1_g1_i2:103-714(+)
MGCKSSRAPEPEQAPRWSPQARTAEWLRTGQAGQQYQAASVRSGSLPGSPRGMRPPMSPSARSARSARSAGGQSVHSGHSSVGAPSYESAKMYHERTAESQSLLKMHPDKRPVILEIVQGANLPPLHNPKLLMPAASDVGHLIVTVRQRMGLGESQKLFVATKSGRTPDLRQEIGCLYANSKSDDGFLYLWCSSKKFSAFWWK